MKKKNPNSQNNRGLASRRAISNAIDKDLADKLDQLSKDTKIAKSRLLDEALTLLLEKHGRL